MIRNAGRGWGLVVVLVLGCLTGCKGLFGTQGPPDDPLFLNKKPLETKAHNARPVALAYSEPLPPLNSHAAPDGSGLAGTPRKLSQVPGTLTNRPSAVEPEEQESR